MNDLVIVHFGTKTLAFAVEVVEEYATPDLSGSWSHGSDDCPDCGGDNTCVVKYHSCPNHPILKLCYVWYCDDCFLCYEYRLIQ